MTKKIYNKQDFKNKYINLANKELNGEVTEEVFDKLIECFKNIEVPRWDANVKYKYPIHNFKYLSLSNRKGLHGYIVLTCFSDEVDDKEEVSIYDIKGFGDKPTAKPKYTLEDLKNNKIAVHLPTQEEWDRCMKFLDKTDCFWSNPTKKPTEGDFWNHAEICVVIGYYKYLQDELEDDELGYGGKKLFERNGYTIITLDQIEGLEPTAEEETININEGNKEETTIHAPKGYHFEDCGLVKDFNAKEYSMEELEPTAEEEDKILEDAETLGIGFCKTSFDKESNLKNEHIKHEDIYLTDFSKLEKEKYLIINLDSDCIDNCDKVIIKYQGKEKVITRDDFKKTAFGYMKGTLNTPDNLEDLEGLEPTAEEEVLFAKEHGTGGAMLNEEEVYTAKPFNEATQKDRIEAINNMLGTTRRRLNNGMEVIVTLSDVIIKYQGKEKVITRDDFNKDLGFAEGSRAWALLALDRGEMITHKSLDKIKAIYLDKNILRGWNLLPVTLWCFPKDGWEIYEEIEMMLFKEMLKEKGNCSFRFINRLKNDTTIYRRDCGEVLFKDRTGTKNKLSLEAVADLADEQVEIIKGAE